MECDEDSVGVGGWIFLVGRGRGRRFRGRGEGELNDGCWMSDG